MTLSPPANVKLPEGAAAQVLASGFDTIVLAVDLEWQNEDTFELLHGLKAEAKENENDQPGRIKPKDGTATWIFGVKPHGAGGYEWLLTSKEMDIKLGAWLKPKSRPSAMVEIRSESLWSHGPGACVQRIRTLFESMGATIVGIKVSRVDTCADVLVPATVWRKELADHFVTSADMVASYVRRGQLEGIQIGRGAVVARLYDKPFEIRTKSHKSWMFDVWQIESVADDHRIIRVEFQLRREAVKELGIDTFDHLTQATLPLWAYCTQRWLKVQDDPTKHHTQQTTLPWWQVVQGAIVGAQNAHPLIRAKAIRHDDEQMSRAMIGYLTSKVAGWRQGELIKPDEELDLHSHAVAVLHQLTKAGIDDRDFTERVKRKQAKSARASEKFENAQSARAELGISLKPISKHRRKS